MTEFLLWVTAVGAIATAGFTGLLWWVAKGTLGGTNTQLGLLREQAERDGRPYVTLDVVTGLHGIGAWDLVVANSGRSLALDVKFDFDDWQSAGEGDYITKNLIPFLRESQTLVPGARKRAMWRSERDSGSTEAGAPEHITLTAKYSDELQKQYSTEFHLDLRAIKSVAPAPQEGARTTGVSKDANKSLADIDHALRTLNAHVGELRR